MENNHTNIETLNVSDSWKNKFKLINKAGGTKYPNIKDLKFNERLSITFSLPGFLLGPFYYLFKGMWKKSITLLILSIIVITIIEVIFPKNSGSWLLSGMFYAQFAAKDYYKLKVLKQDEWFSFL